MSEEEKNVPWLEPANEDIAEISFLENYRMSIIAASIFVIVAFALIIWQVYSGGDSQPSGEVPLVRAEQGPLKEKPDQPGGMDIPDRDKLVYNRMAGGEVDSEQAHLRPGPEAPMDKPVEQAAQNQGALNQAAQNQIAQNQAVPGPLPHSDVKKVETPAMQKLAEGQKLAEAQKPAEAPKALEAPKPAAMPKPVEALKPAVHEPASAAFNALTGDYLIQLGAFSDHPRALAAWAQIQKKFPADLGKLQPNVITVERGGSGVLYRLQAGKLADHASAEALCKTLSAKAQPCMVVHR